MELLWGLSENLLFLLAFAAFILLLEIGYRFGRRHQRRFPDDGAKSHVSSLQAALLGLLALLLGFNFAMAASRFETRKALIQEEVNAINTTWLRARLLPSPPRQQILNLLKAYVDSRIDFFRAGDDAHLILVANNDATAIENQVWSLTVDMINTDPSGPTKALFVSSLNDVIEINEKRRAALDNHVPDLVINLLFFVALGAIGFIAYGYGLAGKRRHGTTAIFALFISLVLTTILDLDQPRTGFIRVTETSMIRLRTTLAGHTAYPY